MSSLSKIANTELEGRLKDLVCKERKLLHVILEHIKEVDLRKLYLERAYSSMYEYLVKELGYSGSAAMRRLEAARLLKEVPAISEKIQEGSLNLSQIGEFSKMIKEKERASGEKISCLQKTDLISMISGKTTLEAQKELSLALDLPIKEFEIQRAQKNDSVRLELTLTKEQYDKLLQCKDLSAHLVHQNHKDSSWASLIEVLADQYLNLKNKANLGGNKKSEITPMCSSKGERLQSDFSGVESSLETTEKMRTRAESETSTSEITTLSETQRISKSISPKTRRDILTRDRCCQYRDPVTGKQCKSTYGLQVDHRQPRWDGGDNSFSNLSALCRSHNHHKYKKETNTRYV